MQQEVILSTKHSAEKKSQVPLGKNTLDFSGAPIGEYKVFDVWYQVGDGGDAFRICTSKRIAKTVYLYNGEVQVARITFSDDDTKITRFEVANKPAAEEALRLEDQFPFKSLLETAVYGLEDIEYSFDLTPDELEAFERLGKATIERIRLVTVPTDLIVRIFGEENPTGAFHTTHRIDGQLVDTSDMWNKAFGWYLSKNVDIATAQENVRQVLDPETVVIDDNLKETLDGKQLGYHEIIHEIFRSASDDGDDKAKKVVDTMKSAFFAIPRELRQNFQSALLSMGYKPEKISEEFWTFYLSLRAFPPEQLNDFESDFLKLGEADSITEVLKEMPFLISDFVTNQIEIKLQEAVRLTVADDSNL